MAYSKWSKDHAALRFSRSTVLLNNIQAGRLGTPEVDGLEAAFAAFLNWLSGCAPCRPRRGTVLTVLQGGDGAGP
jgi:hypothetical protein